MSNELIRKPDLNTEIIINIESLGTITSNLKTVRDDVVALNNFYSNVIYDETQKDVAKADKAKINKYKDAIKKYIKDIENKFNEPLEELKKIGKEMEGLLKDTYTSIDEQVSKFEIEQKNAKIEQLKEYYNEYAESLKIDFIPYERMNLNVTLSASMKSLKEQIKTFLDEVILNVNLINSQEYSAEIMVEYKQSLNALEAITKVNNRKSMLKREEEIREKQAEEWNQIKENLNKFQEAALEKPIEEVVEEKLTTTFTVSGTLKQLKLLKQFIQENGMEIIKN